LGNSKFDVIPCHNLRLGLATKAKACKVASQEGSPGVKENVREWTFTFPKEVPLWKFESRWTLECSKSDCKNQNPMAWRVIYTIGMLLKHRSKMGLHDPFGYLKHKLWPKEGRGVKLAVWFPTIKSKESTRFPCVQVACDISLKSSWRRLQLCYRLHLNQRSSKKVMGPQSRESPNFDNFETPTWESWDKKPFGCGFRGEAQSIL